MIYASELAFDGGQHMRLWRLKLFEFKIFYLSTVVPERSTPQGPGVKESGGMEARGAKSACRTCIHTYIQKKHVHMHACIDTWTYRYTDTWIDTYIHTHVHACVHARMHACTHTHTFAYIHACMQIYVHTSVRTEICTCVHTYIHTYIDTH